MEGRILVTGATGFIGSALVQELCHSKKHVVIFVPKDSSHPFLENLSFERINGDIADSDAVLGAMHGCDYVYHLAALPTYTLETKDELFRVNVEGTRCVMEAALAAKVKKVVHVSSTSVFGFTKDQSERIDETYTLTGEGFFYSESKIKAEEIVQEYSSKGLNVTIVNPASVVGKGEITPIMLTLTKNIEKGRIKFAFPGTTCHVAVQDVAHGLILAMEKGKKGERYILSDEQLSFKEKFNIIAAIIGKPTIKIQIPKISYYPLYFLSLIASKLLKNPPITPAGVKHAYGYRNFDASKAKKELGWNPTVSFKKALEETIEYYKARQLL